MLIKEPEIAFIANSKWYIKNFRESTLTSFTDCGFKCYVYTPEDSKVTISNSVCFEPIKLKPQSKNIINEIHSLISIITKLSSVKHRLVFSFNPKTNLYTLIAGVLLKKPVVVNVSGVGQASLINGFTGLIYKSMISYFYKKSAHCFFQNSADMNHFIKIGYISSDKASLLPGSGVDLNKFKPNYITNSGRVEFLMASRLIKQKGVIEYLESANKFSKRYVNSSFILAGVADNTERGVGELEICSYTKNNNNIKFIGQSDEMHKVMRSADVVVLPSYYPEGTPRVLLEAAASGKIIITTNTPGCSDVVVDGLNGFLIEPRSAESLLNAMEKIMLLSDQDFLEMKKQSRLIAERKFDEKIVIQEYLNVADRVINGRVENCNF
ncbi:glycosyltransferase family 4 protein [Cobetia amphilecti]|uniref:glycosyltransferase family 4 protein n=1 Tax=Cobetia amphilecti TaxID=1055104 RepID=UPI0029426B2D|nr:glycosyltransferase family 4 protein [Cobetia amphilecti]WOI24919.1 glycosyltransferase family 4 protein [Cobetia amphilecti]